MVDLDAMEKHLMKLRDKKMDCMRRGDYVGANKVQLQMKQYASAMEEAIDKTQTSFSELLADKPHEVQRQFSIMCSMIIFVADMMDSTATDFNDMMRQVTGCTTSNMDPYIRKIKEGASIIVKLFDRSAGENDKVKEDFGEFGDKMYNVVKNQVMLFVERHRVGV